MTDEPQWIADKVFPAISGRSEAPEPVEDGVQVISHLTNISVAYLHDMTHPGWLGGTVFGRNPHDRPPQPVMEHAIRFTALRRRLVDNPLALAVLEHHRPTIDYGGWCEGCDSGPEDDAHWPCSTVELLERMTDADRPAVE